MTNEKNESFYIDNLQKLDLNEEEALIYFTLIKHGKLGTIARKLNEELYSIERTRIYSILRKLNEKGCIIEGPPSEDARKPKTYIAEEPVKYFNKIYNQIEKRLEELDNFNENILEDISNLYTSGLEISPDDLDSTILPYFKPLLKKGWKVKSQKIEKGINLLGGDLYYEYQLQLPKDSYKKIDLLGFLISIFDSDIEKDDITLKFFINQLKKIIKQMHQADFHDIKISDGEIEFIGKKFPSIIIKAKEKKSQTYIEFGGTVVLPIKNKIFFIWEELQQDNVEFDKEELHNLLEEMVELILRVEGISFQKK